MLGWLLSSRSLDSHTCVWSNRCNEALETRDKRIWASVLFKILSTYVSRLSPSTFDELQVVVHTYLSLPSICAISLCLLMPEPSVEPAWANFACIKAKERTDIGSPTQAQCAAAKGSTWATNKDPPLCPFCCDEWLFLMLRFRVRKLDRTFFILKSLLTVCLSCLCGRHVRCWKNWLFYTGTWRARRWWCLMYRARGVALRLYVLARAWKSILTTYWDEVNRRLKEVWAQNQGLEYVLWN